VPCRGLFPGPPRLGVAGEHTQVFDPLLKGLVDVRRDVGGNGFGFDVPVGGEGLSASRVMSSWAVGSFGSATAYRFQPRFPAYAGAECERTCTFATRIVFKLRCECVVFKIHPTVVVVLGPLDADVAYSPGWALSTLFLTLSGG